jgi:hypothetical protein
MTRSLAWAWLTLGTTVALAAACSSSTAKKTRVTPDGDAGSGELATSGATSSSAGGSAPGAGMGVGGADEAIGGDGATTSMTDGWLSGTRLRAVLQVAGSAKLFKAWHDKKLDVDCTFAFDSGGVERCLPFDAYGSPGASYSDAKCTQPVAVFDVGVPIPPWVQAPALPFACHVGPRYLPVGADVAVTELYRSSGGTCESVGVIGATQLAKTLGPAVPDSTFVAATETRQEPREKRLSANVRYAEDGSRQVTSHLDLERGADCNPRLHTGDGYACVPDDLAYIQTFYANAACDVPVAYHPGYAHQTCGRAPKLIQFSKPNYTDTYFEVGTQLIGTVYRGPGSCKAYVSPGDGEATYFNVGDAVPWSSLPQLSSKNEGTGRILLQVLRGADGELVSREGFFDSTLDTACNEVQASDQKPRCLPSTAFSVNAFADDKCTAALFTTPVGTAPPPDLAYLQKTVPGGGTLVFKLAGKIAPPAKIWQLNNAECVEPAVIATEDYYATTSVPAAELAPVTLETE